jgi:hypothetical protein
MHPQPAPLETRAMESTDRRPSVLVVFGVIMQLPLYYSTVRGAVRLQREYIGAGRRGKMPAASRWLFPLPWGTERGWGRLNHSREGPN